MTFQSREHCFYHYFRMFTSRLHDKSFEWSQLYNSRPGRLLLWLARWNAPQKLGVGSIEISILHSSVPIMKDKKTKPVSNLLLTNFSALPCTRLRRVPYIRERGSKGILFPAVCHQKITPTNKGSCQIVTPDQKLFRMLILGSIHNLAEKNCL